MILYTYADKITLEGYNTNGEYTVSTNYFNVN